MSTIQVPVKSGDGSLLYNADVSLDDEGRLLGIKSVDVAKEMSIGRTTSYSILPKKITEELLQPMGYWTDATGKPRISDKQSPEAYLNTDVRGWFYLLSPLVAAIAGWYRGKEVSKDNLSVKMSHMNSDYGLGSNAEIDFNIARMNDPQEEEGNASATSRLDLLEANIQHLNDDMARIFDSVPDYIDRIDRIRA